MIIDTSRLKNGDSVFYADSFGKVHRMIISDNRTGAPTIDRASAEIIRSLLFISESEAKLAAKRKYEEFISSNQGPMSNQEQESFDPGDDPYYV